MNIVTPIRSAKQPYFGEGSSLRSPRDASSNSQQWKKNRTVNENSGSLVQAVSGLKQEMTKLRRRQPGYMMPNDVAMYPFKIYQVANETATDEQRKIFTDLGLNIDNYTIQIRSGIIGDRSYLNYPANTDWGNDEQQVYCRNTDYPPGTNPLDYFYYQPASNTAGGSVILDNVADTLIYGIPKGSPSNTNTTSYGQIVIHPQIEGYDQFQNSSASFWIEIVDDPNLGMYANLMGRMLAYDPPSFRNATWFPSGPRIIPIGIYGLAANVSTSNYYPLVPFWEQMQAGNLVNRFPPVTGNYRGYWGEIFPALPAGSTHSVFYPGDSVVYGSRAIVTGIIDSDVISLNVHDVYSIVALGFYKLTDDDIFSDSSLTKKIGSIVV